VGTATIDHRVRYLDDRNGEVASIAQAQFGGVSSALVALLESSDVVVYVDRGRCRRGDAQAS
jgi:hypothetical protein